METKKQFKGKFSSDFYAKAALMKKRGADKKRQPNKADIFNSSKERLRKK